MGTKGSGGGGDQITPIVVYRMSLHMGICAGPVDELRAIYVGEKLAWSGNYTTNADFNIFNPELFGGLRKEGGVAGNVSWLAGGPAQVMDDYHAGLLGRTSATCPGFRGTSSLFFTTDNGYGFPGNTGSGFFFSGYDYGFAGFYWSANQPSLKTIWTKVTRIAKGLSSGTARIANPTVTDNPDTNPAHIIYECLTNTDWGMGAPSDIINVTSFEACATTLFGENFGLSMLWTRQAEIEKFVNEILDHIQATLYIDPQTGLYTLKLLREDFDVDTLQVFSPDNCQLTNYQTKAWGETVNEIVVTWTNPVTEEAETVSVQDIANIAMQGGQIVSDSRNYYGVRTADLAARLGGRDLRAASAPVKSAELLVNRKGWNLVPGEAMILHWPEHSIDALVMRVMDVDYGKPGEMNIKVTVLEDIFKAGVFIQPQQTQWIDPSEAPAAMAHVLPLTLPAFMTANVMTGAQLAALQYPEVRVGVLAAQAGTDTGSFELESQVTREDMTTFWRGEGRLLLVGYAVLIAPFAAEATTTTFLPASVNAWQPPTDGYLIIGDDAETVVEIARLRIFNGVTGWTIDRGVFDTVPKAWPIGTPVWYVSPVARVTDPNTRAGGDVVNYKLLTRTSKGLLAEADAPVETVTLTDRPWRPNRPGNVKVATVAFGEYDALLVSSMAVTWGNRNRLLEDVVILKWADGTVTPEVGQTTTITLMNADDRSVVSTINGLAGTSYALAKSAFGTGVVEGILRVTAKRDGLESLQGQEIRVKVRPFLFTDLVDGQPSYVGQAGKFVRVNAAGTGLVFIVAPSIQIGTYQDAVLDVSQILTRYVAVAAFQLKANLAGCQVNVGTAATNPTTLSVKKNGTTVGTIIITVSTPAFATTGGTAVSFAAGDILELSGPASPDGTLSKLAVVLIGPKV